MVRAKLFTRDGGFVTDFLMPEFLLLPEVAIWGTRTFILKRPFEQTYGMPTEAKYYEACAWSVDASKMLAEPIASVSTS